MAIRYAGKLFRALNPVYAREPLSGEGAVRYGGRFNRKGTPALYCSLTILTAVREANQAGTLQPTTLVSYKADIEPVFDTRDATALRAAGADTDTLADTTWRDRMASGGLAPTQALADQLIQDGFAGLLVRSFAPGASAHDLNLVLWRWGAAPPVRLTLIDDEGRLSRPAP